MYYLRYFYVNLWPWGSSCMHATSKQEFNPHCLKAGALPYQIQDHEPAFRNFSAQILNWHSIDLILIDINYGQLKHTQEKRAHPHFLNFTGEHFKRRNQPLFPLYDRYSGELFPFINQMAISFSFHFIWSSKIINKRSYEQILFNFNQSFDNIDICIYQQS